MAKQSFLVVSLKENKTRKLAQILTNETSLKILDYLTSKDATETGLAKGLNIPISTIHYNLKILSDSKMIKSEEFHYSDKGKMVNHYTLANKYILIAPEREAGLRARLNSLLPVSVILLAVAGTIHIATNSQPALSLFTRNLQTEALVEGGAPLAEKMLAAAPQAAPMPITAIALWFLLGSFVALSLYLVFSWFKERD